MNNDGSSTLIGFMGIFVMGALVAALLGGEITGSAAKIAINTTANESDAYVSYLTEEKDGLTAIYENIGTEKNNDFFIVSNQDETLHVVVSRDGKSYTHEETVVEKDSALNEINTASLEAVREKVSQPKTKSRSLVGDYFTFKLLDKSLNLLTNK